MTRNSEKYVSINASMKSSDKGLVELPDADSTNLSRKDSMESVSRIQLPNKSPESYRNYKRRARAAGVISIACLIVAIAASFMLGRYSVDPFTVMGVLISQVVPFDGSWSDAEVTVVMDIRLPRIIAAVVIGSALAVAGASYQGIFQNPVVSPDILGASAGASVGAALAMLLEWPSAAVQLCAFVLGLAAVSFAYGLSKAIGRGGNRVLMLVLCGMVASTLFQAGVSIIKYLADPNSTLPEITYWLMGSIAKVSYSDLLFFCIPYVVCIVVMMLLRWKLNVLTFGEEEARTLGVNAERIRIIVIACATLLTSATVSIAGTVGWVGLMIPHLVRFMVGSNYRLVLPLSLVAGAVFLLVVDNVCRCLLPYEIPLGILTAIIGAPFFVFILFQRKGELS